MPTDHERDRNRAKQKQFQKRHPGYRYRYVKLKRILNPDFYDYQAHFRTFELVDPRDEEPLPRVIGYCKVTNQPVWSTLWALKDISGSHWAAWLRELATLGLTPVERLGWALGTVIPINRCLARRLAHERVKRINQLTTGKLHERPSWLLRGVDEAPYRRHPVGRLFPDGRVERFKRMRDAVAVMGPSARAYLAYWIQTLSGPGGCIWFDD
jgi:hypothetical protein